MGGLIVVVLTFIGLLADLKGLGFPTLHVRAPTPTPTPTATAMPASNRLFIGSIMTPEPHISTTRLLSEDERQIVALIEAEAEATLDKDIDRVMSLYSRDAKVRDYIGEQWKGYDFIRERYEAFFDLLTFISLRHYIIELDIRDDRATATTQLYAEYLLDPAFNRYTYPHLANYEVGSPVAPDEAWTFAKQAGVWKIISFLY